MNENYSKTELANSVINSKMNSDLNRVTNAVNSFSGEDVSTALLVEVVNENGEPLSGSKISINGQVLFTDADGVALFAEVNTKKKFGYVKAEAGGYFDGSRTFIPSEDGATQVKIKLLPMNNEQIVSSENGGEASIDTPYGVARIIFNDGFIDADGNAYHGGVHVYSNYLDPKAIETGLTMPGDLLGVTSSNSVVNLVTYGMVNVELRGDNGEELQITSRAEMRVPIHPDQLSNAPSAIPMWYFNEAAGIWVEEGEGIKEGNEYVAHVAHFTTWNCDRIILINANLTINVVDQFGNPIPGAMYGITSSISNSSFWGYTNSNGIAYRGVAGSSSLTITAVAINSCNSSFPSNSISITAPAPYSSGSVTIPITIPYTTSFTITGRLSDCSGPVIAPFGYAIVTAPSMGTHLNYYYTMR